MSKFEKSFQKALRAAAAHTPDNPWGRLYGCSPKGPSYILPDGSKLWMHRKGQRVRFYDVSGTQVGPEQANVSPAVLYANIQGWRDPDMPRWIEEAGQREIRSKVQGHSHTRVCYERGSGRMICDIESSNAASARKAMAARSAAEVVRGFKIGDHVCITSGKQKGMCGNIRSLHAGPSSDRFSVALEHPVQAMLGPAILDPGALRHNPGSVHGHQAKPPTGAEKNFTLRLYSREGRDPFPPGTTLNLEDRQVTFQVPWQLYASGGEVRKLIYAVFRSPHGRRVYSADLYQGKVSKAHTDKNRPDTTYPNPDAA